MEEKLNELINIVIAPFLKSHGFKKQKQYFHKTDRDFTFSINFPVDREYTENGAYVWMICGIYSAEFEGMMGREIKLKPRGYDNIFSHNFSTITGTGDERLLIEKTSDLEVLGKEMIEILDKIMAFYSTITTLDVFINHCLTQNYLVHHEDLLRYLAIKNDENLTAFYFTKIKERLQRIADNAFEAYQKKSEKLRAEYAASISNDSRVSSN